MKSEPNAKTSRFSGCRLFMNSKGKNIFTYIEASYYQYIHMVNFFFSEIPVNKELTQQDDALREIMLAMA